MRQSILQIEFISLHRSHIVIPMLLNYKVMMARFYFLDLNWIVNLGFVLRNPEANKDLSDNVNVNASNTIWQLQFVLEMRFQLQILCADQVVLKWSVALFFDVFNGSVHIVHLVMNYLGAFSIGWLDCFQHCLVTLIVLIHQSLANHVI